MEVAFPWWLVDCVGVGERMQNYDECHCKVGKESESVIHLRQCFSKTRPPKPKMVPVGGASRPFLKLIISKTGSVLIFSQIKAISDEDDGATTQTL